MINWFEIPVGNMPRAIAFYENFLEATVNLQDLGDFKMALLGGQQGALIQHSAYKPSYAGTLIYLSAHMPIVEQMELAVSLGGKILRPAALISEDFGFTGIIEDTEGNRIGIHGRV
ncbi:MAG: glyoxalase [Bacteroidetes bacterium B1(2017)]|nr:MAG: glyoxalase [Bacteroidetes bacterium B1(2017)]